MALPSLELIIEFCTRVHDVAAEERFFTVMEPPAPVDLTSVSFDEFVSFLFDHDVPPESEKYDPWYFHVEVEFDAKRICAYYVQMFRRPEFLLSRFTKPQLEQGFWAIQGPNLECSVSRIILDSGQPLFIREECIASMVDLFERLFAGEPLDSSAQMWWDSLCFDWDCDVRNRERGGEDLELQDIFFRTLAKVLAIDSWTCQAAALHGLGHLHHPNTRELIDRFLDGHPSLTQEQKAYALAAANFDVL